MLTLLCGGQGTLSKDLFRLTANAKAAEPVYAAAAALLGDDPRSFVERDTDVITANRASQILVVTALLATHACIADHLPRSLAVTGYSVGEMAAWSIAGVWSADTALALTARRAEAMDAADGGTGRLGFVHGLSQARLDPILHRHDCAIAIVNPGDLFIVGGGKDAVRAGCNAAAKAGAGKSGLLDVHVASHTAHLAKAVPVFSKALKKVQHKPVDAGRLLFSGGDGVRLFHPDRDASRLAVAVSHVVDWAATLRALAEAGVEAVLDLGPGHALADMARGTTLFQRCYAAAGFRSIGGLRAWLDRQQSAD